MHWKTIPNTRGVYQITECGKLRVHPRTKHNPYKRLKAGDEVKTHISADGYYMTNIHWACGRFTLVAVHRLLLMTFRPTRRKGDLQVNHKDGNKLNNSLDNLEWCTHKENLRHAWDTGLRKRPDRSILTPNEVREIRAWRSEHPNMTLREIGEYYRVSSACVWRVIHRRNWKHIL